MPLIYIHGVKQRNKAGLERLQTRFVAMMQRVSSNVPSIGTEFSVHVPYWGDKASRTDYESILPATLKQTIKDGLEALHESELGFARDKVPEDELSAKGKVEVPFNASLPADDANESMGPSSDVNLSALRFAARNHSASIDALIRSLAAEGLAEDEQEDLDRLLRGGWEAAYALVQQAPALSSGQGQDSGAELPDWMSRRTLDNVRGAVERAATLVALGLPPVRAWVDNAHRDFNMFMADATVYILEREKEGAKGPIISSILREFDRKVEGPLIVITHSMGGAICYDVFSRFRPELKIDCWISVGGQVAQFQNLGLFPYENKRDSSGRICGLRPRIKCWYNVYDELDFLNFVASPVFADAVDVPFSTGRGPLSTHSGYWSEPRFYDLLSQLIVRSLGDRA